MSVVLDLAAVTADDFEPFKGQGFETRAGRAQETLRLELVTIGRRQGPPGHREPFSLMLRGPRSPVLAQGIFRLSNQALGELELFLVPIGADQDGITYEAAFG